MKFVDDKHEKFYYEKMCELLQYRKNDVYYTSLIYTLAICDITRNHFKNIFNIKEGTININALSEAYQTSTSIKVTRLAFNLFNSCIYDTDEDIEKDKVSKLYAVDNIFCCTYAPFFYESIKLRYPEYTNI